MKFIGTLVGILLPFQMLFAQGKALHLKIQVINQKTKIGVATKGISLLPSGSGTTDSDGKATITIPSHTKEIELQVPPGFEIVNPPGPRSSVPDDKELVVRFWVNEVRLERMEAQIVHLKQERDVAVALASELELKNQQLGVQTKHLTSENAALQDSLREISEKIEAVNNQVLTLDQEIAQYKLAFYDKISTNYQQFLNALLDMEVALSYVSQAFTREGELRNFNERINALNLARNEMHENHLAYVKVVEEHWNKETSLHLSNLYEQALHKIYGNIILPLNDELIATLRDTWNGNKPRIFVQRKAVKRTNKALEKLHQEIDQLEDKASLVLPLLASGIDESVVINK